MSKNAMANKEVGKTLADVLKTNTVLTHLDISENAPYTDNDGPGFAQELAIGVAANGALTSLNISSNKIGELALPKGWTKEKKFWSYVFKHTDGREQQDDPSQPLGAIALADAIKNNGALTSLDLSNNSIGELVKGPLPEGWKSRDDNDNAPWLRIADGHEQHEYPGEERPEGIIAIAHAIPTMGALASLDLSQNSIPAEEMGPIERLCQSKQIALRK